MERLEQAFLERNLEELGLSVFVFPEIDSTNDEAKRYVLRGGKAPAVFLAETQHAGRGRMGRSFYSPAYTGIYLSLLICPKESDAVRITTAASVAVHRAVRSVTGISTRIKWVNDLYVEQKKVCGILAESFVADADRYVIVGVGINLETEDFPKELRGTAGSLHPDAKNLRNALAARVIREMYELFDGLATENFMDEYRAHSMVLGQAVTYTQNGVTRSGVAEAIDEMGRLQIALEDGTVALLSSGEISLRLGVSREE